MSYTYLLEQGGGILGGKLLGHTCVCAVEIEPYCREVLLQRQRDGVLPRFPIWDDVRTFDGTPWKGKVDVICGGFPCQDISIANPDGEGLDGDRSGLWSEMGRIIGEVRPIYAFIENSPRLAVLGGNRVIADLAGMGFDCTWGVMGSRHTGLPCKRDRIWILASGSGIRRKTSRQGKVDKKQQIQQNCQWGITSNREDNLRILGSRYSREILSRNFRGCDELADRMDRLTAIGNGQVPTVVELAWKTLISINHQ